MEKKKDKKVLDFLMDDGIWENMPDKKIARPRQKNENQEITPPERNIKDMRSQEMLDEEAPRVKDETGKKTDTEATDNEFGEIDYAILRSVTLGFKTIKEIAEALQIRTMIIEKHIYRLIKDGSIKYFQYCVITSKGKQAIEDFVKNNPEDVWQPIDEFIGSVIVNKKERNLKIQKMIDIILLISMIVLIVLIIYFGLIA